jgi:hypothetical protein
LAHFTRAAAPVAAARLRRGVLSAPITRASSQQ